MRKSPTRLLKLSLCILATMTITWMIKEFIGKTEETKNNSKEDDTRGITVKHVEFGAGLNRRLKDKGRSHTVVAKKTHVMFLRADRVASPILRNILFHFGMMNNLSFGMFNSFGTPHTIGSIQPSNEPEKYAIVVVESLTSHVTRFTQSDAIKITFLMNPIFALAKTEERNKVRKRDGTEPDGGLRFDSKSSNIKHNQLVSRFGFAISADKEADVDRIIDKLKKEFDLILMSDRLEESLVLLRRTLGWNYTDILYIAKNFAIDYDTTLPDEERAKLQKENYLDVAVYEHLSKQFDDRVDQLGDDFDEEVVNFRIVQTHFNDFCTQRTEPDTPVELEASAWHERIVVYWTDCEKYKLSKVDFIN